MSLLNPAIEAFVAVAKFRTVHRAAEEIGLTQTGVTQRIRSLEKIVGTTLFSRSRKGMTLTAEGEILFHEACQLLEFEGSILSKLDLEDSESVIRISISAPSSVMRSRVINSLSAFASEHRNIIFSFVVNDDGNILSDLKVNRVQLAIIPRSEVVDEVDTKLLKGDEYILVGPSSWRDRELLEIIEEERIVDFNQEDDFTYRFLKSAKLLRNASKDRYFVNNVDGITSFVLNGNGYSVLPKRFVDRYIESGELIDLYPGKTMKVEYALAWYPRHEMPSYFKSIIDSIYRH